MIRKIIIKLRNKAQNKSSKRSLGPKVKIIKINLLKLSQ
jgi:hypothetical protein